MLFYNNIFVFHKFILFNIKVFRSSLFTNVSISFQASLEILILRDISFWLISIFFKTYSEINFSFREIILNKFSFKYNSHFTSFRKDKIPLISYLFAIVLFLNDWLKVVVNILWRDAHEKKWFILLKIFFMFFSS